MNPACVATKDVRTSVVLRTLSILFLAGGVVLLTYAGYVLLSAHNYQARERNAFEAAQAKNVNKGWLPLVDGETMGEMEIARLGLKVIVVQGDSTEILQHAIGHLSGTALPGGLGNVVLAGHRDTFFRLLRNIRSGDAITFKTLAGEFRYRVESTRVVPPSDVSVLRQSGGHTLTLVTCFPFYYIGAAPDRFIVRARQVETWPEAPPTR